eukprot:3827835-Pleurochrysis_carterae.AAC.1
MVDAVPPLVAGAQALRTLLLHGNALSVRGLAALAQAVDRDDCHTDTLVLTQGAQRRQSRAAAKAAPRE